MKHYPFIPIFIVIALTCTQALQAQQPPQQARHALRQGNRSYFHQKYAQADSLYQKALTYDSTYAKAHNNIGNSSYRGKDYARASEHYSRAAQNPTLQGAAKSKALYNLGNSQLQAGLQARQSGAEGGGMEQFQQAVNNYQEALKINPKDNNAKYNLSYAKKMLAQAQQQNGGQNNQGGGQDQNQQDQNQQNQQQQQQNQNQGQNQQDQQSQQQQDQQQQQGNDQQDRQQKQQQQKQQQQKEQKKRDAEQLLNAMKNNEKNTMKNQIHATESKVDGRIEKDW